MLIKIRQREKPSLTNEKDTRKSIKGVFKNSNEANGDIEDDEGANKEEGKMRKAKGLKTCTGTLKDVCNAWIRKKKESEEPKAIGSREVNESNLPAEVKASTTYQKSSKFNSPEDSESIDYRLADNNLMCSSAYIDHEIELTKATMGIETRSRKETSYWKNESKEPHADPNKSIEIEPENSKKFEWHLKNAEGKLKRQINFDYNQTKY
ncbi:17637_t:CDS:2 [Dentiscutata erythropus]|uniref:17637_t:CDS:1 n=1 Tax=Dentiscutata erythropus TaxID=1348616 RepID=A0A9N8ZVH7_9GLOM|nr:17637_t:CDS:2 [Dentiscutata erythropus]